MIDQGISVDTAVPSQRSEQTAQMIVLHGTVHPHMQGRPTCRRGRNLSRHSTILLTSDLWIPGRPRRDIFFSKI
jgi:hypothetical protein